MNNLPINDLIAIPLSEIEVSAIRSQGAGGQHVNKVATGIHLRFAIDSSSLPDEIKQLLLNYRDHRISKDGVIVIKAQQSRSQEMNRQLAFEMLQQLVKAALIKPKARQKTKPSRSAKERRMQQKNRRGQIKALRGRVQD